jgi:transposase
MDILAWIQAIPGPFRVVYEARPTGFVLARALREAGIDCLVAPPSKLQRPSGDRVKTDRNDALHLARLLNWTKSPRSPSLIPDRKQSWIWSGSEKIPAGT